MSKKHGIIVGLLIAASGCASSKVVQRGDGAAMCGVEDPRLQAAPRDFDRSSTISVIGSLTEMAAQDREQLKTGARSAIGARFDQLASQRPHAFIANDVAELATRLRQLDCSVRAGMPTDTADQRYAQILAELKVEKNILDPSVGSEVTKSRAVQ